MATSLDQLNKDPTAEPLVNPPQATPQIPQMTTMVGQPATMTATGTGVPGQPMAPQTPQFAPTQVVQQTLDQFIGSNSPYMRNAQLRGLEQANQRGMLNSSISAGAAQRAAMETAMPLVDQSLGLQRQREGYAFQGEQAGLDRSFQAQQQDVQRQFQASQADIDRTIQVRESQLNRDFQGSQAEADRAFRSQLQSDSVTQQDWLASQAYTREFNGQLSLMPIQSSYQLNSAIQQYALENPEIYTPDIISGMTNFFQQNMMSILATYFPSMVNTSYGGGG